MTDLIRNLQQDSLKSIYQKHGIVYLGLFGSNARGEDLPGSDIDLLLDFKETKSLFDLAEIKLTFQDLLGKKVDIAIKGSLKKTLKPYIDKDLITVYEQN